MSGLILATLALPVTTLAQQRGVPIENIDRTGDAMVRAESDRCSVW